MKTQIIAALAGIGLFASAFVGTAQAADYSVSWAVPSAANCPEVHQPGVDQTFTPDNPSDPTGPGTCTRVMHR
jgi:hypothetical protein